MSGAWLRAFLAALILGAGGCGGGTDVDNALVQGQVRDGGTLVASARVTLMPDDYNPVMGDPTGRTRTMLSDHEGKFGFPDLAPGNYSLEVLHPTSMRMGWVAGVSVSEGGMLSIPVALDTARSVVVQLPESTAADAYVFIPGTSVHALRDSAATGSPGARFTLMHVPSNSIPNIGVGSMANPAEPAMVRISLPSGRADTSVVVPNTK